MTSWVKLLKHHWLEVSAVAFLLLLPMALLTPALGQPRCRPFSQGWANLSQLSIALSVYADEFAGAIPSPESWHQVMDPWLTITMDDPIYGSPRRSGPYYMLPVPWPDGRIPDNVDPSILASTPLFFEDPTLQPKRTWVAFWDGSVRSINDREFTLIIDQTKAVRLGLPQP